MVELLGVHSAFALIGGRAARTHRLDKGGHWFIALERCRITLLLCLQIALEAIQGAILDGQTVCGQVGNERLFRRLGTKLHALVGNGTVYRVRIVTVGDLLLVLLGLCGVLTLQVGKLLLDTIHISSRFFQFLNILVPLGKLFLVGEKNLYPDDMKVKRALDTAAVFYPDFDRSYAESLAKQFELPLNKKINGLSTGYGSIFRLILGLSVNTPYVLFDEPVLGLDAQHRDLFYKLLVQKYAEHPCTMVVSTHLIAEVADLIEHTVIIRKGRILQDAPTEELTAACWAVSGPAGVVDSWAAGRDVFTSSVLGGLKTVCIRGGGTEDLPAGLERRRMGLQEYFISLMEEEDQR